MSSSDMDQYEQYKQEMQKISDLKHAIALMHWDQEVYLPKKATRFRSQQVATLSGMSHEMFITHKMERLLKDLKKKDLPEDQKRNVEETWRDFEQQKKYPTDFVVKLSKATSESFNAWKQAKEEDDFSKFAPKLSDLVQLKREECELLGYQDHPYDALLDQFEPYTTTKDVEATFQRVRDELVPYVHELLDQPALDDSFFKQKYDRQKQWDFGMIILEEMGYNFDMGRQDIAPHPFTISLNPEDVRVTTRINEQDLREMTWSTIHECGHALYEQGLKTEQYGLPLGSAVSLGIHESQSRLWENNVGRSLAFCKAYLPVLKDHFPQHLKNISVRDFYKALNIVQPSLIRTAADELTYHLHILIRFEIEKALLEDQVQVDDLPALWNQKYKDYLGVDVPSDAKGILQDVHWSHGSFGYFPTYSLGSFYAAQFFAEAQEELPELEQQIEDRTFKPLLDWLRKNIHRHGRKYPAKKLCQQVTGESLNFDHFMNYARNKFNAVYGVKASTKT